MDLGEVAVVSLMGQMKEPTMQQETLGWTESNRKDFSAN